MFILIIGVSNITDYMYDLLVELSFLDIAFFYFPNYHDAGLRSYQHCRNKSTTMVANVLHDIVCVQRWKHISLSCPTLELFIKLL